MRLPASMRVALRRSLAATFGLLSAVGVRRAARGKLAVVGSSVTALDRALGPAAIAAVTTTDEPAPQPDLRFEHGPLIRPRPLQTVSVVVDARDPRCSFRNNVALDHRRRVITEERLPRDELPVSFSLLEPVAARRGTVAYLSNTNVGNFYHWIALTLPLLRLYAEHDVRPDAYYVGRPVTGWHLETLAMLGIHEDRVVSDGVTADRLVTAVVNRRHGAVDTASLRFVREQVGAPRFAAAGRRRLVIGRGDVAFRRFVNEQECVELLTREFGFEYVTMDGKTVTDEIELFSSAEAIVGVHGAALTNLLWARPECKVLELLPFGWNHPGYQELAAFVGCPYGYIVGSPDAPRAAGLDKPAAVRRENDLLIDPSALTAAVRALGL